MRPRLSRAGEGLKERKKDDEQPRRNITGVVKWDGGGGRKMHHVLKQSSHKRNKIQEEGQVPSQTIAD